MYHLAILVGFHSIIVDLDAMVIFSTTSSFSDFSDADWLVDIVRNRHFDGFNVSPWITDKIILVNNFLEYPHLRHLYYSLLFYSYVVIDSFQFAHLAISNYLGFHLFDLIQTWYCYLTFDYLAEWEKRCPSCWCKLWMDQLQHCWHWNPLESSQINSRHLCRMVVRILDDLQVLSWDHEKDHTTVASQNY